MGYISQFEASDIDSDDIDLQFEVDGVETGTTVSIVDECGHAAQIITALLDELEHYKSREERVTKLVMDNSTSWDALYKKLEAAEKRLAEQSAIVAAAEKLVRCKGRYHSELNYRALAKLFGVITPDLPPLEHENVHYADAANVEITALRQRIAELEAKLETADKLQDGAFRDGLKAGFSYGQTDDQSGFAQCMSAYSTRTDIGVKVE
ncbi:ead/Ea22-like family protein [Salmonella enterica subsp. enterica serovar Poona]|nr:ead/Ea22-like family protein [Salmonella enterica subsp. enterica serovar Poona]EDT7036246.1 ead/Ea22-like family protein [Salmonella enterica subsp. enterica serovar Soahanina]EID6349899.1 ead/Ea22-like family protein [Salmonella enterica]MCT7184483.1 ead/Ea22-like family protein [Salmonella enterica subsp. enterica serovar Pomona]MMQ87799.1 ead/Ea22-like family protein [Salmonella enterica subsp. enterica serovar Oranienburg]